MARQYKLKIGVIGTGAWGKNHLRVFSELGVLQCLCEADSARATQWSSKYGVKPYSNVDDMLRDEKLDAVTICTPSVTHFEIASKTLAAGINTFVEKPMTATSAEGRKLVEIAKDSGATLSVGFIERFNPAVIEAKKVLKELALGEPLLLEFHRENKWAGRITDVGIVLDTSVHDIDLSRWLLEEEPETVYARAGNLLSSGKEDFAIITLGFRGNKSAFIMSNGVTPKRLRTLTIVCTKGVISLDFISQEVRLDDDGGTRIPRKDFREPLTLEMESFLAAIQNGRSPVVKPSDGLNTTIICEAAVSSAKSRKIMELDLAHESPELAWPKAM